MTTTFFARVWKTNVVLGVLAVATSTLFWGAPGLLASALGAGLATLNLWAIRRLAGRAMAHAAQGEGAPAAGALLAGLAIKMVLLIGLVWVLAGALELAMLPFALGILVLVVSLVVTGLRAPEGEVSAT